MEDRKTDEITHLAFRLGVKIAGNGTLGPYIRKKETQREPASLLL